MVHKGQTDGVVCRHSCYGSTLLMQISFFLFQGENGKPGVAGPNGQLGLSVR